MTESKNALDDEKGLGESIVTSGALNCPAQYCSALVAEWKSCVMRWFDLLLTNHNTINNKKTKGHQVLGYQRAKPGVSGEVKPGSNQDFLLSNGGKTDLVIRTTRWAGKVVSLTLLYRVFLKNQKHSNLNRINQQGRIQEYIDRQWEDPLFSRTKNQQLTTFKNFSVKSTECLNAIYLINKLILLTIKKLGVIYLFILSLVLSFFSKCQSLSSCLNGNSLLEVV